MVAFTEFLLSGEEYSVLAAHFPKYDVDRNSGQNTAVLAKPCSQCFDRIGGGGEKSGTLEGKSGCLSAR